MGTPPTLPPVGLTCALKGPQDHLRGECTATRAFSANTQRKPLLSHTSNSCHLHPNARQQLAHRLRHSKRTPGSSTGYKRPSNPRAGMRHPHRHAARTLGHAPSVPVRETPSRVVTTQTGHTPRSPQAHTPHSLGLAGSSPPGSCAPVGYGKAGQTLTGSGPPVASSAQSTPITPTRPSYPRRGRARRRFPWPRDDESARASAR